MSPPATSPQHGPSSPGPPLQPQAIAAAPDGYFVIVEANRTMFLGQPGHPIVVCTRKCSRPPQNTTLLNSARLGSQGLGPWTFAFWPPDAFRVLVCRSWDFGRRALGFTLVAGRLLVLIEV